MPAAPSPSLSAPAPSVPLAATRQRGVNRIIRALRCDFSA